MSQTTDSATWQVEPFTAYLSGAIRYTPRPWKDEDERAAAKRAWVKMRRGDEPLTPADKRLLALYVPKESELQADPRTVPSDDPEARICPGVRVHDDRSGITYEVGLAEDGTVAHLSVIPHRGVEVDETLLRAIPLEELRQVAANMAARMAARDGDDEQADAYLRGEVPRPGPVRPSHEQVARDYHDAKRYSPGDIRAILATQWDVSKFTVDKYVRLARQAGVLEPGKRGRPTTTRRKSEGTTHD